MSDTPRELRRDLPTDPAASLALLARTAEEWGAEWRADGARGGRLRLPVAAGLRHGWVAGRVDVEPTADGTRLVFREEEGAYHLETAAVITLVVAACGALVTVVAPLFPRLLRLVPLGILLAVGAWLFIVSRLRNSGPEELFDEVSAQAHGIPRE